MIQARKIDMEQGVTWIADGFRNFAASPGMWILLGLAVLVIYVLLSVLPFIGSLLAALLAPVLGAGALFVAKEAAEGRPIEFGQLFRGFEDSRALNGLLTLGAVMVAGTILCMIVVFVLLGGAIMAAMSAVSAGAWSPMALGVGGLVGVLLVLLIQLVMLSALVYAVPLVMFRGAAPAEAMKSSLDACTINFLPLLIFSLAYLIVAVIASLPILLGWLVLMPASIGMLYASYRDLFGA